jgi:hypothetical protein
MCSHLYVVEEVELKSGVTAFDVPLEKCDVQKYRGVNIQEVKRQFKKSTTLKYLSIFFTHHPSSDTRINLHKEKMSQHNNCTLSTNFINLDINDNVSVIFCQQEECEHHHSKSVGCVISNKDPIERTIFKQMRGNKEELSLYHQCIQDWAKGQHFDCDVFGPHYKKLCELYGKDACIFYGKSLPEPLHASDQCTWASFVKQDDSLYCDHGWPSAAKIADLLSYKELVVIQDNPHIFNCVVVETKGIQRISFKVYRHYLVKVV